MDAKVLRAAVSAAIRVTVSTTLIGCGGNATTDAKGAGPSRQGDATTSSDPNSVNSAGGQSLTPYPSDGGRSNDAQAGNATAMGGNATAIGGSAAAGTAASGGTVATGGVDVGGTANAGGAPEESSAGAAAQTCAPAAEACLTTLEQAPNVQPPPAATQACCDTVLQALSQRQQLGEQCYRELSSRFTPGTVRPKCCTEPSSWSHPACTPWGPPVPPELSPEALRAWSQAA